MSSFYLKKHSDHLQRVISPFFSIVKACLDES